MTLKKVKYTGKKPIKAGTWVYYSNKRRTSVRAVKRG